MFSNVCKKCINMVTFYAIFTNFTTFFTNLYAFLADFKIIFNKFPIFFENSTSRFTTSRMS